MNDLFDRVDEFIQEHGYVTGQEFLDITNNDMPLYHAYVAYWDAIIIPDLSDEIERRIRNFGAE